MVSHWSLSDSKSPQVSRTFLSILAILSNTVVWMVSTRPLISKFPTPFTNPLVIVPRAPITTDITLTFIFHSFSIPKQEGQRTHISFRFLSISLNGQPGQQSLQFSKFSYLLLIIIRSGRLAESRWSVYISKSPKSLCVLLSRTVHIPFVRQTPEENRRTYRPERCGNNNKDEDNIPKTLNAKNHQASSQKFRKLISIN